MSRSQLESLLARARSVRAPARTVLLQATQAWSYAADALKPVSFPDFEAWCAAHAGLSARVVLAGALTHQLVADPALPLNDSEAVLAWARHQFVHYHGAQAQRWSLSVWANGPHRGASALHGIELDTLLQSAARHRVRLRAIEPWWSVALRLASQRVPLLARGGSTELWLVEGLQLTRLRCADGRVLGIEQRWLDSADEAALAQLIEALCGSQNPPWVLGCALAHGALSTAPAARSLGSLQDACPAPEWVAA